MRASATRTGSKRNVYQPRRARQSGPHRGRRWPGPSAPWSGVDRSAAPIIANYTGGQHAGVVRDDGRGGAAGDGAEVGFHPGPGVLPVVHVIGRRVDRGQRLPGARFDVGDVLLVHCDVLAGGEPAEVPADEVGPRVGQRGGRGGHVPDDVLAEIEVVDGHPAGVDDVDEHQGVVAGEVDVDVVGRVVGAVPGQLGAL